MDMLANKCELAAIQMILTKESTTCKCSFFDLESIEKHNSYMGARPSAGCLFLQPAKGYTWILYGSDNMIRKGIPDAFSKGIMGQVAAHFRASLRTQPVRHLRQLCETITPLTIGEMTPGLVTHKGGLVVEDPLKRATSLKAFLLGVMQSTLPSWLYLLLPVASVLPLHFKQS